MKVDSKGDFKPNPFPLGMHHGICYSIIDLGHQAYEYMGEPKVARKVMLTFEVPAIRIEYEKDGQKVEGPKVIGKEYTASLGERANLRKDLESWRSKAFTSEELEGFELSNLLGVNCLLNVVLNEKKTYSKIAAITPLLTATKPYSTTENKFIKYDIEMGEAFPENMPQWIRDKVLKAKEFDAPQESFLKTAEGYEESTPLTATEKVREEAINRDPEEDDLPF